jgi:hypothetical protein
LTVQSQSTDIRDRLNLAPRGAVVAGAHGTSE